MPSSFILNRLILILALLLVCEVFCYPQSDSSFHSAKRDTARTKLQKTDNFYDSLKSRAYKHKWSRELHNIVIVNPTSALVDTVKIENGAQPFVPYQGLQIRNIRIKRLNIFGASVNDTIPQSINLLQRAANNLHMRTLEQVIQKYLLFETGDTVNALELADNERVLRSLSFIEDARFYIRNTDSGYVDIDVVTRDLWSIGFNVDVSNTQAGKFEVWNRNIFGLGREVQHTIPWDIYRRPMLGYTGNYSVNNIAGSFTALNVQYSRVNLDESVEAGLNRKFFTPETRFAGGFLFNYSQVTSLFAQPDSIYLYKLDYNYYDAWAGWSMPLANGVQFVNHRMRFIISARYSQYTFFNRPASVSVDRLYPYHNRKMYMLSLSLLRQNFFKTNMIYNFGRTEDIPYGFLLSLTGGYEADEFINRYYCAATLAQGTVIDNLGYNYFSLSVGTFFHTPTKKMSQGVLRAENKYFTNLYIYNRFKFRYFLDLLYVRGLARNSDEYLFVGDGSLINGLQSPSLFGKQKLSANLEAVCFTPWFIYGFRFVPYIYSNWGFLGENYQNIFSNDVYAGFGIGIRVRNERLVFNTLSIRVGYYPFAPKNADLQYIDVSSEERYQPHDFLQSKPAVVDF